MRPVKSFLAMIILLCAMADPATSFTLLVPNGGENWTSGDQEVISWDPSGITGNILIELNRDIDNGRPWVVLFTDTPNDGNELWDVTGPATTTNLIRITSIDQPSISDQSDANFTIILSAATISVLSPNGSESWYVGETHALSWSSNNVFGDVIIELNRDFINEGEWEVLFDSTSNDGSEDWIVTEPVSSSARIRVSSLGQPAVNDISDADFSIISLSPPAQLTAYPSGSDIILRWEPVSDATSYEVFKSLLSNESFFDLIATLDSTNYTDQGASVTEGKSFYQVRAVRTGEGMRSPREQKLN